MSNSNSNYVDFSAFDAAVENLDSSLNTSQEMTQETCAEALMFEALKRMAGFEPRVDVPQDEVENTLASKLMHVDNPMQSIVNNIARAIQGIKADANNVESNAEECGVTEAPKGSVADEHRDQLESILSFCRSLARQVTRAGFYRYRSAERALDKKGVIPYKNEAGIFIGRYDGADYAELNDNAYNGWSKVSVKPDTIANATIEVTDNIADLWEKVMLTGAPSAYYTQQQKFNLGGIPIGNGDYQNFISVVDAWENFQSKQKNQRVRKDASQVVQDFVV